MIVRTTFRAAGGLVRHLKRVDTNERVLLRHEFFRGVSDDLELAARTMEAYARSRALKRAFVHVVISPETELGGTELTFALSKIEQEYNISTETPRLVVQHWKGSHRPAHYHVAYSALDLGRGRAIKSHNSFKTDELISRQIEIALGHRVVPGPNLAANIATLRERGGDDDIGDILAHYAVAISSDPLPRRDRRQGERLGVDPDLFSKEIYKVFLESGCCLESFGRALEDQGYNLSYGCHAIFVGEDRTGYQAPLVRLLRREGKAAGAPLHIKECDLKHAFPELPEKSLKRDMGLRRAETRARAGLELELARGLSEAIFDGDPRGLEEFRTRQKQAQDAIEENERREFQRSLRARRDAIDDLYRAQEHERWRRVDRAFRWARAFADPQLRTMIFRLAALGLFLSGAGFVTALCGATVATALLPSRERANRIRARAKLDSVCARANRQIERNDVFTKMGVLQPNITPRRRPRFSFDQVTKPDRILAGFYAQSLLNAEEVDVRKMETAAALGSEIVVGLEQIMTRGSRLQINKLLRWYHLVPADRREVAIGAALRRHKDGAGKQRCDRRQATRKRSITKSAKKRNNSRELT